MNNRIRTLLLLGCTWAGLSSTAFGQGDNCSNAELILSGATCSGTSGTTVGATPELPAADCDFGAGGNDVWYAFEATSSEHTIQVITAMGNDVVVELRTADCPGSAIACVDNMYYGAETIHATTLDAGTTYNIRLYGYDGDDVAFSVCVFEGPPPCDNASNLDACGGYGQTTVNPGGVVTTIATDQYTSGEYSEVLGITAGEQYEFTIGSGGYITVYQDGVNTTLIGSGPSPLTVTAVTSGNLYPHWTEDAACNVNCSGSVITTVQLLGGGGGGPENDDCTGAEPEALAVDDEILLSGDNTGATQDVAPFTFVWEAFTLTECATVTIDYCVAGSEFNGAFMINLTSSCPDILTGLIEAPFGSYDDCSVTFAELAAGTWYIPVLVDAVSGTPVGAYTIGVSAVACPNPPANDLCADAEVIIPGGSCTPVAGATAGATVDLPAASCDFGDGGGDVWYVFEATATSHTIQVTTTTGNDVVVELLTAGCPGTSLGCADGWVSGTEIIAATSLDIGSDYYVRVYGYDGASVPFTVCVLEPSGSSPCDDLTPITDCGMAIETTIDAGAGSLIGYLDCTLDFFPLNGREYVYSYTPIESGNYTLEVTGLTINTPGTYTDFLYREGSCAEAQSDWTCLLDVNGTATSAVFPLTAGNTYYFLVKNEGTDGGSATWQLNCNVVVPPNDNCTGAEPEALAVDSEILLSGDNTGATEDVAPYTFVWEAFTLTECATVTIDYCVAGSEFNGAFMINLTSSCPDILTGLIAAPFGSYDDCSVTFAQLAAGTWYIPVLVDAVSGTPVGAYAIGVSAVACPSPPANDDCANAILLPVNAAGDCPGNAVEGDNAGATQDGGEPECDTTTGLFQDVWYTFESGTNSTVSINVTPGDGMTDLLLEVYDGPGCAGSSLLCEIGTDAFMNDLEVVPGNTYTVRVSSNTQWGMGGSFAICISEPLPPYDPCASISPLSCGTATGPIAASGNGAWDTPDPVWGEDYPTPGQEQVFTFTAPVDGDYAIEVLSLEGSWVDFFYKEVADGCNEIGWTVIDDLGSPGVSNPITLSAGTSYYIMWDPEEFFSAFPWESTVDFRINCPESACTDPNLYLNVTLTADGPLPTWEVREVGSDALVQSGGGGTGYEGPNQESLCAPEPGNYYLVMGGGSIGTTYELRTADAASARVIDNVAPVASTHQVNEYNGAVTSNGTIQLPVAETRLIHTSCDKYWWITNEYIVANEDPEVAAEWVPGGANSQQDGTTGYDFWFFDPNGGPGGYSFIRQRRHNNSDGFGSTSSARTCHARVNGWSASVGQPIPANVPLNVRVRAVVNGVPRNWGPACQFVLDPVMANCPPTNLISIPGHERYSCGVTKQFTTHTNNRLFAQPVSGANQYEFQFRLAGGAEGPWSITRSVSTYYLNLGWSAGTAAPLVAGSTYDVRVRARKGTDWCVYGPLCQVTISSGMAGGGQNSAMDGDEAMLGLWPNPNRGDQLNVSLSAVPEGIGTVTMDLFDLSGKRVTARTLQVQDGYVNTVVDLNGDLAAGVYMVQIIAGERSYIERLVIQP